MKRKDIMLRRLDELLTSLGYERITTPGIKGFFKVYPNYIDLFTVGFYTKYDFIDLRFGKRSFPEVATLYNQIFEKTLYQSWAWCSKRIAITPIIKDNVIPEDGTGYYGRDHFSADFDRWTGVDTEKALFELCDWIAFHLENEESEFSKRYRTLPSVLKKMEELDAKDLFWADSKYGILYGNEDAQFTGLIISKLCNDPRYEEKLERVKVYFSEDENEEWLPYFERFCSIIEHVEPRYNV
ncbi:MAG: hypothetical protein ACFNO7_00535 [Bacteroides sp.]